MAPSKLARSFTWWALSAATPVAIPMISPISVDMAVSTSSCAFDATGRCKFSGQVMSRFKSEQCANSRQIGSEPNQLPTSVTSVGIFIAGWPP